MKKLLVIGATVVGAALLAKRLAPKVGSLDWEKRVAAMPDTARPKWMFTNITAIRDNTERILGLLEPSTPGSFEEIDRAGSRDRPEPENR